MLVPLNRQEAKCFDGSLFFLYVLKSEKFIKSENIFGFIMVKLSQLIFQWLKKL